MGTRSLTVFQEEKGGDDIVVMYRQMDGYPTGHGDELAQFLKNGVIVNGLSMGDYRSRDRKLFNGMGCLAAAVVAHFKDGAGSIYLYPAKSRGCGEEYIYYIYPQNGKIWLTVESAYGDNPTIYDGHINEFDGATIEAD